MKIFLKALVFLVILTLALLPLRVVRADDDNGVSFQAFYDQLAGEGTWIQTSDYGYVFQPTVNDPNWRPYTYGHWVSTPEGMMWVSDEPFGWATYHYGRWVDLDDYGWVWVPGYTWAPAWVSWREGDNYCGWAPLPPDTFIGIDYFAGDFDFGFHIGDDCDLAFGIGPGCYNFCPTAYIGDPHCWRHFADRRDNFAIIDGTRNVTNINVNNDPRAGRFGRVHEDGPSLSAIDARSRTPIREVQLAAASTRGAGGRLHGNALSVYAPNIDPRTVRTARPHSVSETLTRTSVNRGIDINRPLAVNSHLRPAGATAAQIHAATLAQGRIPVGAKIDTSATRISRPLNQPLASFHPNTAMTSRHMGEATLSRTPVSPAPESRYTGESVVHHEATPSATESRYTGGPVIHHQAAAAPAFRSFAPNGSSYHPSSVFHQSSAPAFHSSAPAYHPQPSFHSFAPAPHFGGGAPAAHFSGGGHGGGGRPGGGHVNSGNQQRH